MGLFEYEDRIIPDLVFDLTPHFEAFFDIYGIWKITLHTLVLFELNGIEFVSLYYLDIFKELRQHFRHCFWFYTSFWSPFGHYWDLKKIYTVLLSIIRKSALMLDQYLFWFLFNRTLKNVCSCCMNCCYTDLWGHFNQWEDRIWSHEIGIWPMRRQQGADWQRVMEAFTYIFLVFSFLERERETFNI